MTNQCAVWAAVSTLNHAVLDGIIVFPGYTLTFLNRDAGWGERVVGNRNAHIGAHCRGDGAGIAARTGSAGWGGRRSSSTRALFWMPSEYGTNEKNGYDNEGGD